MLGTRPAVTNLAVKDVAAARRFYESTLGLRQLDREGDDVVVYASGETRIFVYRSDFAGTNKATALTWEVPGQLDTVVKRLRERGVRFEHYDMPGLTREGDIHVGAGMRVAWFKDPDGNILNLVD